MFDLKNSIHFKDIKKQIYPYKYYTDENIVSNVGIINDACEIENWSESEKQEFIECVDKSQSRINETQFDMRKYCEFYLKHDVDVMDEGLKIFQRFLKKELKIDMNDYLTISSLGFDFLKIDCLTKIKNLFELGGHVKDFISKARYGGRCMTAWNLKWNVKDIRIGDFDAVSLYPSAMSRLYIATGKPIPIKQENLDFEWLQKNATDYFVDVEIMKIGKKYPFSLVVAKTKRGNEYTNSHIHPEFITDSTEAKLKNYGIKYSESGNIINCYSQIELEDLINFQKVEFKIIRGYNYTDDRDLSIQNSVRKLFKMRFDLQNEKQVDGSIRKNPLESIIKLLMNSLFGKSIQKTTKKQTHYKRKTELNSFCIKNYNQLVSTQELRDDLYEVITRQDIDNQFNLVQLGVNILSMSKRIMNEVMCLAHDLGIRIFYQDTDSMHIELDGINPTTGKFERDYLLNHLSSEYEKIYNRKLIGSDLGQFHSDFEKIGGSNKTPWSKEAFICGKKFYCDRLVDEDGNEGIFFRGKGIKQESFKEKAYELYKEKSTENKLNYHDYCKSKQIINDISDIYSRVFYNETKVEHMNNELKSQMTFSLVTAKNPCFKYDKLTVRTENIFTRIVTFIGRIGDVNEYFNYTNDSSIYHQNKSTYEYTEDSEDNQ